MYHFTMGINSEKCIARQCHCVNIMEFIYTLHLYKVGGLAYTPRLYGVSYYSHTISQYCILLYKQHEMKSSTRENNATER